MTRKAGNGHRCGITHGGTRTTNPEQLEPRVLMDSAFAAVGYRNVQDPGGGTRQVMFAIEAELDDATGQLDYRIFTDTTTAPPLLTTTATIDAANNRWEADLFNTGSPMTGTLAGATGERTGWLVNPRAGSRLEEMSWWVERPASVGTADELNASLTSLPYEGFLYHISDANALAGRTHAAEANFDANAPSLLKGHSVVYAFESFSGNMSAAGGGGKYTFALDSGETAWVYQSADFSHYIAVQPGHAADDSWVSVGHAPADTLFELTEGSVAGSYRVARQADDLSYVNHHWMQNDDEGVLTLQIGGFAPGTQPSSQVMGVATFTSDRTGETYEGYWTVPTPIATPKGLVHVFFEPNENQPDIDRYAITFDIGNFDSNAIVGSWTLWDGTEGLPTPQPNRLYGVRLSNVESPPGGVEEPSDPDGPQDPMGDSKPMTADEFIAYFRQEHPNDLAIGDDVIDVLDCAVPFAFHERTPWSAENYWFQDSAGDVWALWHGGAVHLLADGEHMWTLTNLADAAGLTGRVNFAPGSMSGVMTAWQAFSIQGIVDGDLVSLWWSPESARLEWGDRLNGWVLTPFTTEIFFDADTRQPVESLPSFRPFTETQHNGRFFFDPRATRREYEFGMSVVLVDDSANVYVATFSTADNRLVEVPDDVANIWMLERIEDVPGMKRHNLLEDAGSIGFEYVVRTN